MTDKKFTITSKQFYERYKEEYDSHNGGAWLILMERLRHFEVEGWDGQHDQLHDHGELPIAAACYAVNGTDAQCLMHGEDAWPWEESWDKRGKHDRIKQLVIAGSLIAAEIDRLNGDRKRYDGADLKQWALEQSPSVNNASVLKEALEKILNGALPINEHQYISWIQTARGIASEALSALHPLIPQTPRTPRFQPGELDTVGEHPSDREPEGEEWDATEFYSGDLVAYADRILRDKGASNKDVLDGIEQAVNDLKGQYNILKK